MLTLLKRSNASNIGILMKVYTTIITYRPVVKYALKV